MKLLILRDCDVCAIEGRRVEEVIPAEICAKLMNMRLSDMACPDTTPLKGGTTCYAAAKSRVAIFKWFNVAQSLTLSVLSDAP